jgi:EAL domain-containing protein (putative c-di-GMP-specific phosphodiesterase class I)
VVSAPDFPDEPTEIDARPGADDTVRSLIGDHRMRVVFQPIVDLDDGEIFAHEALVRPPEELFSDPPTLFEAAVASGCCGELGRSIRDMAVQCCASQRLFLNIHPNELNEGWLVRPDDAIFQHSGNVYLEITESVPLSHFRLCRSILGEVRSKGISLAVDDLGAGFSNLRYIADLAPEVVKLDRELIAGLVINSRLHRLVKSIVRLCSDMGAKVVAEGIETLDELAAVRDAGVHYGQGFYLARPAYPPPIVEWETIRPR